MPIKGFKKDFVDGDTSTGGQALTLEIKGKNDQEYKVFCATGLTHSMGLETEEYATFCSNGQMVTQLTSGSHEFSGEGVLTKNGGAYTLYKEALQDIYNLSGVSVKITDIFHEHVIEFVGTFTEFEVESPADELIKASFTVMPSEVLNVSDLPPALKTNVMPKEDFEKEVEKKKAKNLESK